MSKTSNVKPVNAIQLRRKSALCWMAYGARKVSQSYAAKKVLPRVFITNGPKIFWRLGRNGSPVTSPAKPAHLKLKSYHTQQFVKTWGDAHLQRVIGWFEKAHG